MTLAQAPAAHLRARPGEYVIELQVADFAESELAVEALGPQITVRGDQVETGDEEGTAFRVHEHMEETFRLPDDAVADDVKVFHGHGTLEIHAPRARIAPRRLPIEHTRYLINPDAEPC
jgi:HSP20 family molecular chaperone IbpA